ncbi:hypothetical protein ACOME3_004894 [Neoechinorhynchus agilis]
MIILAFYTILLTIRSDARHERTTRDIYFIKYPSQSWGTLVNSDTGETITTKLIGMVKGGENTGTIKKCCLEKLSNILTSLQQESVSTTTEMSAVNAGAASAINRIGGQANVAMGTAGQSWNGGYGSGGMQYGTDQGMGQGMGGGLGQGMDQQMGGGMGYGMGQQMGGGMGYGMGQQIGGGMGQGMGQGMGGGMGQGMGGGIGQGMGQGMGYGMGQGMGQGMGYGMGQGMGQGMGYGMGHGMGYGMGQGMGQQMSGGMGQGMNQGMKRAANPTNEDMRANYMPHRNQEDLHPFGGNNMRFGRGYHGIKRGYQSRSLGAPNIPISQEFNQVTTRSQSNFNEPPSLTVVPISLGSKESINLVSLCEGPKASSSINKNRNNCRSATESIEPTKLKSKTIRLMKPENDHDHTQSLMKLIYALTKAK